MTQSHNSTDTKPSSDDQSLATLRGAIDKIDNQLLALLAERQGLSRQIVKKKVLGSNVFRPDREVSLLRNLVTAHPEIDARLIMGLWRHIISASIAEQKPDYTIAHTSQARTLADIHSAGYMQCHLYDSDEAALQALSEARADCVIIHEDDLAALADRLGPRPTQAIYVAASIGFLVQDGAERGYILCREMPEDSGDDKLIVKDEAGHISHHQQGDVLPKGVIIGKYATAISRES